MPSSLTKVQIQFALWSFLQAQHANDSKVIAINYFSLRHGNWPIDTVVVTEDEIVCYVIAATNGNFHRVSFLSDASIFDRLVYVTTSGNKAEAKLELGWQWKILIASGLPITLKFARRAGANPNVYISAALELLKKPELHRIAREAKIKGATRKRPAELIELLSDNVDHDWLRYQFRKALMTRPPNAWSNRQRVFAGQEIRKYQLDDWE